MPRPQGLPKTGGRKKGTPNRRTGILAEELHCMGFHPAAELARLIPKLEPEAQARTLVALLGFLYPKKCPNDFNLDEHSFLGKLKKEQSESAEQYDDTTSTEAAAQEPGQNLP
jgi:hypothetical protein